MDSPGNETSISVKPKGYWKERSKALAAHKAKTREFAAPTKARMQATRERWNRFCHELEEDPDHLLQSAEAEHYKTFFEWLLDRFGRIRSKISIDSYWQDIRMLFTEISGSKIGPVISKEITLFIKNDLVPQNDLTILQTRPKYYLTSTDLFVLLHYHWCYDDRTFPHERYRIQLPLITQFLLYSVSRPGAIVESNSYSRTNQALKYKDIQISLIKHPNEGRDVLVVEITFRLYKGRRSAGKRTEPTKFIFHERDDHPAFCPVLLLLGLAFADEAFEDLKSPQELGRIVVPSYRSAIQLKWKDRLLETPIFRQVESGTGGVNISSTRALPAQDFGAQLRKWALMAGFSQNVRPYDLRRGAANAVEPHATTAQRNQIMGHARAEVFNHYISQTVAVDTQSAFLGTPAKQDLLSAVGRMSMTRDPRAPKRLTGDQVATLRQDPELLRLVAARAEYSTLVRQKFGKISNAKGDPLHEEYTKARKAASNRLASLRSSYLRDARNKFFSEVNGVEIRRQLTGKPSYANNDTLSDIQHLSPERSRIARALFDNHKVDRWAIVEDIRRLCSRQELRNKSARSAMKTRSRQTEQKDHTSAKLCHPLQCLFCLGNFSLTESDRNRLFARSSTMRKHVHKAHLQYLSSTSPFTCTHPACTITLDDLRHFKNHAIKVHGIAL